MVVSKLNTIFTLRKANDMIYEAPLTIAEKQRKEDAEIEKQRGIILRNTENLMDSYIALKTEHLQNVKVMQQAVVLLNEGTEDMSKPNMKDICGAGVLLSERIQQVMERELEKFKSLEHA